MRKYSSDRRELIQNKTGDWYAKRRPDGTFKSMDERGPSLRADVRQRGKPHGAARVWRYGRSAATGTVMRGRIRVAEQVSLPRAITLMPDEQGLYEQIEFDPHSLSPGFYERLTRSCNAAKPLALSLIRRDAIPAIRWAYFVNPEYNVGSKRSRLEIFESNGTRGEEILEHGHFLTYLEYFIHGPKLPPSVSDGFCELMNRDCDRSELRAYARNQIRAHGLDRRRAAEEFYKLALECDLPEWDARSVREAALSTR